MILALAVALSVFPGRFVEESDPTAKSSLVEAAVVFPYLTPEDRAVEEVIAASLLEGTADYTKSQMRQYSTYLGEPLRCTAMPDCMRITIGVRRDDWKTGLRMLKSLLTQADLSDDALDRAKSTLPFLNRSPWKAAFDPVILAYDRVRRRDVTDFIRRNFVPEAISIVVSGPFVRGEPRDFWEQEIEGWDPGKQLRFNADKRPEKIARRPDLPVSILRWDGPELPPDSGKLAAPLLAAFALGIGKESAAFRVLREKERLSYRQEAVLAPFGDGFRLELMAAFLPREDESSLPARTKADMLADIDAWTDATRLRAVAMARSAFQGHAFAAPLAITSSGSLVAQDQFFLEAYWPMKTGQPWSTRGMLTAMEGVSLSDLKASARDLFEKGTPVQSQ